MKGNITLKSLYNLNMNKIKPGWSGKSYDVMLFFYQFLYVRIIIESKKNRWLQDELSDVSNYCDKTHPMKCLMYI